MKARTKIRVLDTLDIPAWVFVRGISAYGIGTISDPFLHEYSGYAPPTMNNYINKLSHWYIEQSNFLSGSLV